MAQGLKLSKAELGNYGRRVKLWLSLAAIYAIATGFGWLAFRPAPYSLAQIEPNSATTQTVQIKPKITVVSGVPARIIIPSVSIDLPVDPGTYDQTTDSWTLSGYHAQYAVVSPLANNQTGNTFIYGHNNHYVFWNLEYLQPGAEAQVYTDNNHIFSYIYKSTETLDPADTSVFKYSGPPIMTVQTCSGDVFQWRQMYKFSFNKVVQ